jgi:SAM-dependent methyltransferase
MDRLLDATHSAEHTHFWFRGLRAFLRPLASQALADSPRRRILDCGCGTGANLVLLGRYGRAFGFDISPRGLQFARQSGLHGLARASIDRIPFGTGLFDLVTAIDVLYTLSEEAESAAIHDMYRVLRPGGHLIVNVAALAILKGNHSLFGAEVRRSTRRRLRRLLSGAGFDVVRLTYTNFSLFPLMLAVRTAQRVIGLATPEEAGTDLAVPLAPVNAVLSALLWFEARALRVVDMPIGSSLLCLARKRPL